MTAHHPQPEDRHHHMTSHHPQPEDRHHHMTLSPPQTVTLRHTLLSILPSTDSHTKAHPSLRTHLLEAADIFLVQGRLHQDQCPLDGGRTSQRHGQLPEDPKLLFSTFPWFCDVHWTPDLLQRGRPHAETFVKLRAPKVSSSVHLRHLKQSVDPNQVTINSLV